MNNRRSLLTSLPEDLQCQILTFLDVSSLLQMRLLNHRYRELASRNEAGWTDHCTRLWKTKIHVCPEAKLQRHGMTAYRIALADAKNRQDITMEELCFLVSSQKGTIWSFRFKKSAGADWTGADPWYAGHQEKQMVFLTDNTVKQYIPANSDELKTLNVPIFARLDNGSVLVDPFGPVSWRFIARPMDLPLRQQTGSYLRLRVGGRDVPTYVVRRSPTNNWGFIMESCWGLYASFPLPSRPMNMQLRHIPPDGVRLVRVDTDDEDEENTSEARKRSVLVDDSALVITNEVQWREALLYNFGLTVLPEGQGAAEEFDDTWGEALSQAFQ